MFFDERLYRCTIDKLMERFVKGSKAEALDEEGVWCVCTVVCTESEAISVAIDDPWEIRQRSIIA